MTQPNYYGILPSNVRYSNNLSPMEKIMFTEITALMQKEGYCYASNTYFSNLYNVHKNTVSVWINNLKKYGFISVKLIYKHNSKEVRQRQIYPINENIDRYQEKDCYPINENIEDNTIKLNTTRGNPTEEQVINKGKELGYKEKVCINFYLYYESKGWKGTQDFVPLLRKWNMNEKEDTSEKKERMWA